MKSHSLLILKSDIKSSTRGSINRLSKHLFTAAFSMLLILAFIAGITGIIVFILQENTVLSDMVSPGDFFFTVFVIVMGRAAANTFRLAYRDPSVDSLLVLPLPEKEIYRSKLYSVFTITLFTFTLFYLIFLALFLAIYRDPIEIAVLGFYTFYFYLVALFGTLVGFSTPLLYHLPNRLRKKALLYLLPSIAGGAFVIDISNLEVYVGNIPGWRLFPLLLLFFNLILLFLLYEMDRFYGGALQNRIHNTPVQDIHLPKIMKFIRFFSIPLIGGVGNAHRNIIAAKELLSTMRDSYFYIYAGVTATLTVTMAFIMLTFPLKDMENGWKWLIYPVIVSFSLYIEGSFMVTLGTLSLIGKEGKRLWILKSLPVSGYDVLSGKALSVIIPSIFGGYFMVLPLLMIAKFPAGECLIFLVLTLSVILAFSGIGILAGSYFPNFSEGSHGSPEIVFQLFVLFICLILIGIVIIPPIGIYYNTGWMDGLFASFIVLLFSYSIYIAGVKGGVRAFQRLGSEDYEE